MGLQKSASHFGLLSTARRARLTGWIEGSSNAVSCLVFAVLHDGHSGLCSNSNKGKNRPDSASSPLRGANLRHLLPFGSSALVEPACARQPDPACASSQAGTKDGQLAMSGN